MEKDKKEGILIQFPKSREYELIKSTRDRFREEKIKKFSDAFDILGWEVKSKEIAIISFSSKTLDYIALATKKRKVVTEKNKIEFSHIIDSMLMSRGFLGTREIQSDVLKKLIKEYLETNSKEEKIRYEY